MLPPHFRCFHYSNINMTFVKNSISHSVKIARIQSFSGPYFHAIRLNLEIYIVNLRIQSKCGKLQTRKTPKHGHFLCNE